MAKRLPITREPDDEGFVYRRNGKRITATAELERIEALAVPPAWSEVEIAASARSKVLARGIDDAGRSQSIYSSAWRRRRDRQKFDHTLEFAIRLPQLRSRVDRDLRRTKISNRRVIACVVRLIDLELFRVGNMNYAREHASFGITTLRQRHVRVHGATVVFDYEAKGGKRLRRTVRDARIARPIARLLELPVGDLFRFLDEEGDAYTVGSRRVNDYVQEAIGREFSAKDFRTWGATAEAAARVIGLETDEGGGISDDDMCSVVDEVAERLGNTPAVARTSYIDPRVLDIDASRATYAEVRRRRSAMRARRHQSVDEQCVILLLKLLNVTPSS